MPNSIYLNKFGPDWPLGSIVVPTPGTPVSIMSIVDSSNLNAPGASGATSDEYARAAQQIIFMGYKAGANGLVINAGNIYIVRVGVGSGTGNRNDYGAIVMVLTPGQVWTLSSAPANRNVFNPYDYRVDADTANDAAQVSLLIA